MSGVYSVVLGVSRVGVRALLGIGLFCTNCLFISYFILGHENSSGSLPNYEYQNVTYSMHEYCVRTQ